MVQIHQLRVALVVAAGDHIGKGIGRIQRSQACNRVLKRFAVKGDIVLQGGVKQRSRINDIADFSLFNQLVGIASLVDPRDSFYLDAQPFYGFGGIARGIDGQSDVVQLFGQGHDLLEVMVLNAYEHAHIV